MKLGMFMMPYHHPARDLHRALLAEGDAAGAAALVLDRELTPGKLKAAVEGLLGEREKMARMAAAASRLAQRDGAARIAEEILGMAEK